MKNIEKYQKLIAKGEVDALLLTSKHNRQYAAEYCIAEGVAVICKTQSYYFTDFRYIESAQKNLPGFAVKMVDTEHPYTKLINEAISDNTVKTIGFEDDTLTVEEYTLYNTKLNAVLHPYAAEINAPRASKEPWEIEYMKKAQEITDRTFDDLLNVIHPGMTEKELCAELIYRLYKYGSEGPSFDPITVSGPNTSLPHGVPSERELQYGDFVTMDEIAMKLYIPASFEQVELTDEDREAGYIAYFTMGEDAGIGIQYVDMSGMSLEEYAQVLTEEYGYECTNAVVNGLPALGYSFTEDDRETAVLAFSTEKGYILEIAFAPTNDEGFGAVATVLMASVQAAE